MREREVASGGSRNYGHMEECNQQLATRRIGLHGPQAASCQPGSVFPVISKLADLTSPEPIQTVQTGRPGFMRPARGRPQGHPPRRVFCWLGMKMTGRKTGGGSATDKRMTRITEKQRLNRMLGGGPLPAPNGARVHSLAASAPGIPDPTRPTMTPSRRKGVAEGAGLAVSDRVPAIGRPRSSVAPVGAQVNKAGRSLSIPPPLGLTPPGYEPPPLRGWQTSRCPWSWWPHSPHCSGLGEQFLPSCHLEDPVGQLLESLQIRDGINAASMWASGFPNRRFLVAQDPLRFPCCVPGRVPRCVPRCVPGAKPSSRPSLRILW